MLSVKIERNLGDFKLKVDFQAEDGVTGILGASGSGKSMTLRSIAGIDRPDRGQIILDGVTLFDSERRINLPPQKRGVGYLFQSYALFPNMTVRKNILCGLHGEKDRLKREKAFSEVMELLRLKGLENHRPMQLSGGQAQRVALARILVNKPKLLMLDEPFSALDSHLRDQLQIEMKSWLSRFDGTVLMVTHSRNEVFHLCDRTALMSDGVFLGLKPTKKLFADPETVSGASMTGCKNITPAVKTGEYELYAPAWGIKLQTAAPLRDELCAVGIRAHYFGLRTAQNRFGIVKTDEMEEPFEWIIRFRFAGQDEESPDIWWRLPKDRRPQEMPVELGISPVNVLPLYPS